MSEHEDGGSSTGLIVGMIVGGVVVIALAALAGLKLFGWW